MTPALKPVAGFEATAYAWRDGAIVWAATHGHTEHPRHATRPWRPHRFEGDARSLMAGAQLCLARLDLASNKGLLRWLGGQPLPFPLEPARPRFDAVRDALVRDDAVAFGAAALRVLGLGHGLTPSGDDFIGAIVFALAHAPRKSWRAPLPAVKAQLRDAARSATNPISAALLDDLMAGASYRVLHELIDALQGRQPAEVKSATEALLSLGASSGADMLAGLLLTLTTTPSHDLACTASP